MRGRQGQARAQERGPDPIQKTRGNLSAAEQSQESPLPPPAVLVVGLRHPAIVDRHVRTRCALRLRCTTVPVRIAATDPVWWSIRLALGPVARRRCPTVAGSSGVRVHRRCLLLTCAAAGGWNRLHAGISTTGCAA